VELEDLTVDRLRELIQTVLNNPGYHERARYFQKIIAQTHGLEVAADVIERAFERNRVAGAASTWEPRSTDTPGAVEYPSAAS
jgi:hypothetical protein